MNEKRRANDKFWSWRVSGQYLISLALAVLSMPLVNNGVHQALDLFIRVNTLEQWRTEHEKEIVEKKTTRDRENDSLARRVDALENAVNVKTGDRFTGSEAVTMKVELQRQIDSHEVRIQRMECAHMNCGRTK